MCTGTRLNNGSRGVHTGRGHPGDLGGRLGTFTEQQGAQLIGSDGRAAGDRVREEAGRSWGGSRDPEKTLGFILDEMCLHLWTQCWLSQQINSLEHFQNFSDGGRQTMSYRGLLWRMKACKEMRSNGAESTETPNHMAHLKQAEYYKSTTRQLKRKKWDR